MNFISNLMTSPWAIQRELLPLASRVLGRIARGEPMSPEDRQAVDEGKRAQAARRRESTTQYAPGGAVAVVGIYGILTQRGGIDDMSTPLTSMDTLARTIRTLATDRAISAIVLDVDSPGGSVLGVSELADAIYEARAQKSIVAVANSTAASAAYWVASQASELFAAPGGECGSIGVYTVHADVSRSLREEGIDMTVIHSGKYKVETNAYGPLSAEARAHVQETVNSHYDAFVRAVARGRGTSQRAVREGMGEGRMLLPDRAKAEKMIDGTATLGEVVAKMQARAAGRDNSRAGMAAFVAKQTRQGVATPSSSPARALTRDAMKREIEVLELT